MTDDAERETRETFERAKREAEAERRREDAQKKAREAEEGDDDWDPRKSEERYKP